MPVSAKPGVAGEAKPQGASGEGATPGGPEVTLEEEGEPEVKSKLAPPPKEERHKTEAVPKKTLAEREEEKALEGVPKDVHDMLKVCCTHVGHFM